MSSPVSPVGEILLSQLERFGPHIQRNIGKGGIERLTAILNGALWATEYSSLVESIGAAVAIFFIQEKLFFIEVKPPTAWDYERFPDRR
jgi:hypothetical protein